jgi:hypothetical protein
VIGSGGRRTKRRPLNLVAWERILCGEFDGRRRERVPVKITGE